MDSVYTREDAEAESGLSQLNGYKREYRSGQYYFQNMKAPMADYQNTASFMNGVSAEMLG